MQQTESTGNPPPGLISVPVIGVSFHASELVMFPGFVLIFHEVQANVNIEISQKRPEFINGYLFEVQQFSSPQIFCTGRTTNHQSVLHGATFVLYAGWIRLVFLGLHVTYPTEERL